MFRPDLSCYEYYGKQLVNVYNIGWIDDAHIFDTGPVDEMILEKLSKIISREYVMHTRGLHYCQFCKLEDIFLFPHERKKILGSAEVWVPNTKNSSIYAAPNLIYHYIKCHNYMPPIEFIESVKDFDLSSRWSAEKDIIPYL